MHPRSHGIVNSSNYLDANALTRPLLFVAFAHLFYPFSTTAISAWSLRLAANQSSDTALLPLRPLFCVHLQ